jgi:hypothetical protein
VQTAALQPPVTSQTSPGAQRVWSGVREHVSVASSQWSIVQATPSSQPRSGGATQYPRSQRSTPLQKTRSSHSESARHSLPTGPTSPSVGGRPSRPSESSVVPAVAHPPARQAARQSTARLPAPAPPWPPLLMAPPPWFAMIMVGGAGRGVKETLRRGAAGARAAPPNS